jgi:cellulose synthase/poly-beta-1,6-N-acetylglucosamine synthase-like glycosyltransferase
MVTDARPFFSILASDYPLDRMEVLVADGMSEDGTRDIVSRYMARTPLIRLLDNPKRIVPAALNTAIAAAKGEVIVRMDAHEIYPPEYLPRLVAELEQTGADNVGGVIITLPADDTPTARAIAVGLSHPFGVGNAYFRIGADVRRWADTVPFGCFRREVFERIGGFDEDMVRNEDDEFNLRLIKHGGRVLLLPEVVSYYRARKSLRDVAYMYFQYGRYKPLVARKVGAVMTGRQLVPALFLSSLLAFGLLGIWVPGGRIAVAAIAGCYALLVLGFSALAARRHGLRCALALTAVFPAVHVCYGMGFLYGVFRYWTPFGKRARVTPAVPGAPLTRY